MGSDDYVRSIAFKSLLSFLFICLQKRDMPLQYLRSRSFGTNSTCFQNTQPIGIFICPWTSAPYGIFLLSLTFPLSWTLFTIIYGVHVVAFAAPFSKLCFAKLSLARSSTVFFKPRRNHSDPRPHACRPRMAMVLCQQPVPTRMVGLGGRVCITGSVDVGWASH